MKQEEEKVINVEFKNKEGKVVGKKQIKNNIFIDATKKYGFFRKRYLKVVEWLINRLLKHADNNMIHAVRFKLVHKYVKQFIIHRGIKICRWIIGKHMINTVEDIPALANNNHQRIWLDSWLKSVEDIWSEMIWRQTSMTADETLRKKYMAIHPTPQHMVEWYKKTNHASHISRCLLGQLYITEVMEDTADRTMNDCFMLRNTHSMMEFYGVHPEERKKIPQIGEYPIFLSNTEKNKPYFLAFSQIPVWYPSDSKEIKIRDLENENAELKMKLEKIESPESNVKVMQGASAPIKENEVDKDE